jgi:hypothetical protein
MSGEEKTYSIALRVRRITYEDSYIAVPVTPEITQKNEDGTIGINAEAFFAEAIRISKDSRVEWKVEGSQSEPHSEQRDTPEGRRKYDAFYSSDEV